MPNYRRAYFEAGTYFFTVVTYKRNKILCTKDSRENLKVGATRRVAPTEVREEHPFIINA